MIPFSHFQSLSSRLTRVEIIPPIEPEIKSREETQIRTQTLIYLLMSLLSFWFGFSVWNGFRIGFIRFQKSAKSLSTTATQAKEPLSKQRCASLLLCTMCTILCAIQVNQVFEMYFKYETVARMKYDNPEKILMPSVTLCFPHNVTNITHLTPLELYERSSIKLKSIITKYFVPQSAPYGKHKIFVNSRYICLTINYMQLKHGVAYSYSIGERTKIRVSFKWAGLVIKRVKIYIHSKQTERTGFESDVAIMKRNCVPSLTWTKRVVQRLPGELA